MAQCEPQDHGTDQADGARRTAHLLLSDEALVGRDLGRYLFILVTYLKLTGHAACLWGAEGLAGRVGAQKWAARLLEDDAVQLKEGVEDAEAKGPADIAILAGDTASDRFAAQKRFVLVKGRRLTGRPAVYDVLFPYMLHPKYYADGRYLKVAGMRGGKRNIGLFFSGNYNERYRNPDILAKFGTLQRPAILGLLLTGLAEGQIFRTSPEFADELATQPLEKHFVFVDNLQGNRVAKGRWLETLARCRFFLACPGVDMPLAHNIVEAMSVGCIPLTQYGAFFDPPLRDGHECIAHNGENVVEKAKAVLAMDPAEIAALRANVIAYYERYLSVDAFKRRVLDRPGPVVRVGMKFMPTEGVR